MTPPSKTHATGRIDVKTYEPQAYEEVDEGPNLVEIHVTETFSGDIEGEGAVRFLQAVREDESASFIGIERVTGSIEGRTGSFLLQDAGTLEGNTVKGDWFVIPGSGTGDLSGLRGEAVSSPSSARMPRSRSTTGLSSEPTHSDLEPLADRVAIVTGAATGIGKGIAARLAADGAAVMVNHLQVQEEEAEAVATGIREAGGSATTVEADISRRDQFAALFERANETFGKINILVNNAAVAPLTPIADATDEQIEAVLAVNIKGTLYGCQLAAQRLVDNGRIINISSSTTELALPGYGIYDMSKGAIEQLTRILAKELGRRGITVNAVSPGATETETYRIGKDPEFVASLERMSAFNRLGRVDDVADVVAFIAGDGARWVTGQNIRVNGGTV